jgi:hypothetical protein
MNATEMKDTDLLEAYARAINTEVAGWGPAARRAERQADMYRAEILRRMAGGTKE